MKDIESREDLVLLLEAFYEKAMKDEVIGHFFTKVVPLDLEKHIPVITDFWESVVFGTGGYRKNVMEVHHYIHELSAIRKEDLDRWTELFTGTVSAMFEGKNATTICQRAGSIATLMNIKLNHPPINKIP